MKLRIEYDIDTNNFTTSCFNAIRDFLVRTSDYSLVTNIITYTGGSAIYPSQKSGISRAYFRSSYSYFVAYSTLNDLYLIFISFGGRVGLFVSTAWDENQEIFYQKDVFYNGFYSNQTDYSRSGGAGARVYNRNFAYYIPMPTVGTCNKLVANYNPENETVMFSGLEPITYNFGAFTTSQNLTHSICFGNVTKYGDWENDGGFWYGGDGVCSLELYFRAGVYSAKNSTEDGTYYYTYHTESKYMYADLFWQFESNCTLGLDFHKRTYWWWESGYDYPWYDDPFSLLANYKVQRVLDTVNNFNKFECFLRINMDYAPNRPPITNYVDEYDIDQVTDRRLPRFTDYDKTIFGTNCCLTHSVTTKTRIDDGTKEEIEVNAHMIPVVMRKQVWARTTKLNYYSAMVASIGNISEGLPSFWGLLPESRLDSNHTVNDLNEISLIMRLYLMVQRDPVILNDFSCVGYNDVINYVNMKNMSTNRYLNGTYPVKVNYYNCFQTGVRRSDLGFKGYAGLAFKMEQQENQNNT